MCGIIFLKKTDGSYARKSVWKRYLTQKSRGMQGYGYISVNKGIMEGVERQRYEVEIEKELKNEVGDTILFHHRYPTSTENMVEATHPIEVSNSSLEYDYYLAHNGIIANADKLKLEHERLGFTYTTEIKHKTITRLTTYAVSEFNDSEALAVEMALAVDGKKENMEAKGSIAFVMFQVDKQTRTVKAVWFGRNHNPLRVCQEKNFISLCSEGAGKDIDAHKLYRMDMITNEIRERALDLGYNYKTSEHYHSEKSKEFMGFGNKWNAHDRDEEDDFLPTGEDIAYDVNGERIEIYLPTDKMTTTEKAVIEVLRDHPIQRSLPKPTEQAKPTPFSTEEIIAVIEDIKLDIMALEHERDHYLDQQDSKKYVDVVQRLEAKFIEKDEYTLELNELYYREGALES